MKLRYKVTIFVAVLASLFTVIALNIDKILPKVAESTAPAVEPKINFLLYDGYYDEISDLIVVNNSPVYSAKIGAKWFIIQNKKRSNESYDEIVGLTGAGAEFGFTGKQNGKWYVIYKGRKIGGPYKEIMDGESPVHIFGFTDNNLIYTEWSAPKFNPNCEGDCGHREPYESAFIFDNGTKIPYSYEKEVELRKTIINEHPPINLERNLLSWDETYFSSVNGKNILVINDFGYRLQYDNEFVAVPDESDDGLSIFKSLPTLLNEINGKLLFATNVANLYVQESDAEYLKKSRWGVFIEP